MSFWHKRAVLSKLVSISELERTRLSPGRLPRHPELPPLNIEEVDGPRLKDYLEKPRLVSTGGRRPSRVEQLTVEQLVPGLAQLSQYYNQTFLSSCHTCDSMTHKDPTAALNSDTLQSRHGNR